MAGNEILGFAAMLAAVGVLIIWFDFILGNLPDAFDNSADQIADGDRSFMPTDLWGVRTPAGNSGGEATNGRGLSVTNGSQTGVQTQSQTQSSNNSLRNSDLIASQDGL